MANINKIRLSGTTYNIEDAALKGDIYINSSNRNSIQSVIKEGVYSLSSDDVYSISGTKTNATDRIRGLIIVDNTSYNFTGSTSSDVEGVSALAGIVTFDLSTNFSISLVNRDTNHINELFIEAFTSSGDESPLLDITITHNPSIGVNKIDYVATLYTEFVHEKYALAEDLNGKQDTLVSGTNIKTINNQSILGSGNITISGSGSGASVVEVTQAQYDALVSGGTLDLTTLYIITDATEIDISNYYTTAQTDSAIAAAVSGKASQSDLETVSGQVANKQDTLVSGTNIKTINNQSILGSGNIDIQGGGGSSYSAGTNINITNDVISCTAPISASSGGYSVMFGQPASSGDASGSKSIVGGQWSKAYNEGCVAIGQMNNARGNWAWAIGNGTSTNGSSAFACGKGTQANASNAFAEGENCSANTIYSHAAGKYTITRNEGEFSIGEFNNSVSASTTFGDSGNTLFSVGNGTSNARHNAFEIRQNGDIYFNDGTNDVKLQDKLSSLDSTIGDINTILQSI